MSKIASLRIHILAGGALGAMSMGLAIPLHAQGAAPGDNTPQDEVIIVTGSRIARPELASPNPIVTVGSADIQRSGETNLVDYLQQVPALVGSLDSAQTSGSQGFIGSTGINLLNLRNLGTERTLVLVDGRRHVAQLPETAAVDIGTIPTDLIERVDVATGGVSGVYGADAVSGVVNFIMKKDFQGLTGRVQYGFADQGEPVNWTASLAGGINFAGGRGNISAAYQFTHEGRLRSNQRDYLRFGRYRTMQRNTDDPDDDPNLPDNVPRTGVRFFDSSREGGVDVDFDYVPDLRPNGESYEIGEFIPPFYSVGGTGTPRSDYIGDVLAKNERHVFNVFGHYEVADALNLFAELKYARGRAFSASQPTFDYGIELFPGNPFLPADIVAAAAANDSPILVNRDNFDLGVRAERNRRETWRSVVGANGDVVEGIRYELSYTYGQSKIRGRSVNNRFNDRFFAALDVVTDPATGQPVCRSNLDPGSIATLPNYNYQLNGGYSFPQQLSFTPGPGSGCLPLNILGEGVANPAAIDWVMTDSRLSSKLTQHVVTGFVSGEIPGFELPGGAIGFVVGAEYRRESSRSTPPPEDTLGQTFGNIIFPVSGHFDVKEAFAEIRLPILADRPFFQSLELSGAVRFSDYSTVGSTTTWNAGLRWAPVQDISFRGTYAQTVRAPNISELFSPQSQTFEFIDDPCDITRANDNPTRAANCATILTQLGLDPATFEDPNSSTVAGLQRGNPDLSEETSKSWTAGAVFRPSFLRGLAVTVDWYDIKIKKAISTAEAQDVANNCVDQPTIENIFCAALSRNPGTGAISSFTVQPENVAEFATRGLDFDISYRLDPANLGVSADLGTFNFRVFGNYLDKLTFIPTPGAQLNDERTEQFAPKWQATFDLTWTKGPLTVNYGFNYFSKTKRYENEEVTADPDIASKENITYNARHTHDIQVGVTVNDLFEVYGGINNFTDQKPDISTFYPVNPIGRFFYVGARATFGSR